MSTKVDQRVVEMKFDNKRFESNIQTTMSSLDKLKEKLNLSGATKGLENVDNAAKNVNMSGLGNAVESVQAKFSALQVVGITALTNITNSAVNAGKRILSALTIDPIKTGFSEYETKINAIQTIMSNTASKGTTMEDVTRVIGELNTYADKTIYNFAEMTRNIGTFTAAGVGLEESAAAIQGIANLAAASGSTSQQASTAMYQLSQAMSSGTVKLMDWNSVVNAGMGGQKFQDALKATAKEHGIAVDEMIEKHGSFRESLTEGWITTEILSKTLRKFTVEGAKEYSKSMMDAGKWTQEQADALIKEAEAMNDAATKVKTFTQLWDTLKESAQSGWSQTWEIIVGDFEEAKETLTKFSDVIGGMIGASADARNELLQGWKDAGGRADLIDSLYNVFEGVMSIVKPIKEAFREIFPPTTVEQLTNLTKGLKNFTDKLKLSDTASENLKRTFKGLFAVIDIIVQIFSAAFRAVTSLFGGVTKLGGGILGVTATIGDYLVAFSEAIRQSNVFNAVFMGVAKVLKSVFGIVANIGKWFKVNLIDPMFQAKGSATSFKDSLISAFDSIGKFLERCSFFKMLSALWKGVQILASGLAKAFSGLIGGLSNAFGGNGIQGIMDFINSLIAGGIGVGLISVINAIRRVFKDAGDIVENFADIFGGVGDVLDGFQKKLKAEALVKIATAVAILAASLLIVSMIDSEKLTGAIGAIGALFTELMIAMSILGKMSDGRKGQIKGIMTMIGMATSVLILASALKTIAGLSFSEMITGLIGVASLMGVMIGTVKLLGTNEKAVLKGATQMIMFAVAVKILASVCSDLADLSWEGLAKGLAGVGILLAEVSLFMNNSKFSGKAVSTGLGIVLIASAMKILASACSDFSQMKWAEMAKGLTGIAVLLAGFAAFTKIIGNTKGLVSAGISMIAVAAAMKIFASAATDFGNMSWESLAKGLVGMAGALVAVVTALNFMPSNMISMGAGLLAVSTAMLIMSTALVKMGGMSWIEIAKGMTALGGAIAILAIGLNLMSGTLAGSAALLVAAVAIGLLTPALLLLGSMSWEAVIKSLLTLAGAFTIVGVAAALLTPIIPSVLAFAGAVALVGVGVLALGAGLVLVGVGLSSLAVGFTAIVASLGAVMTGIIGVITAIATGIANGIISFCAVISAGAPVICEAVTAVVLSVIEALKVAIPPLIECLGMLLEELLDFLVKYTPKLVDAGVKLILGLLDGISAHMTDIVLAAVKIITEFIRGIGIGIPRVIDAGIQLIIDFINGMANGIRDNTDKMIAAVDNLMDAVMDAIKSWFKFAITKGSELAGKIGEGLSSALESIKQIGKDLVDGFIGGVKSKFTEVANAAATVGEKALNAIKDFLGINSPSKEFNLIGRYSGEGLVKGLKSYTGKVASTAKGIGSTAVDSMRSTISGIADAINSDIDSQPTIRPVLDLSNVERGASAINGMLGVGSSVGVLASVGSINASMNKRVQNGGNGELISAINKLRGDLGHMGNTTYTINGVTYDDGSNISDAVQALIRAAKIERRT